MKRRLFEDLVVSVAGGRKRGSLALPVSVTVHAVGVAALLVLPALTTDALPDPPTQLYTPVVLASVHIAPPPPQPVVPPAPRPAAGGPRRPTAAVVVTVPQVDARPMPNANAPVLETSDVEMPLSDGPMCLGCAPPIIPIGATTGSATTGTGGPGEGTGPVRVGGLIRPPTKVRDTRPVYPELAKQVRAQGAVVIECTIAPDGRVDDVRAVSGHPLLLEPALDAVRQWRYTPTLLNGVAVPVIMTVTVNFILS